ncbi:MAG: caspase family protein [Stenomitos rutilans HA7619-LM2]|jgi:hypothetical protein|nr:caspase family protein [Stenomitos rutilans HA7619-LM2]
MASNWAIVIGINQYRFLQPLNYAKRDAEAMHSFLMQEAIFDRTFLFTDDSPPVGGKATEPFRANLLRVLRQIFAASFMKDGDNFWFFFSGHGIPHNGQDSITSTKELKIQLPKDLPTGTFKVVLVIDETSDLSSEQPEMTDESMSFLNVAGDLIGCLEGLPPDLSTNKSYMKDFGKS